MRTVSRIVLLGLFVQAADADEIRHLTFPNVMLGTWPRRPNSAPQKTNLTS